ncbi:ProQ/FINO family protein [Vreelandella populi]|uniref:ABC transporter substrate-binding protein n=1 Tax=Vreelandella populi TaxID=2498858 RepID=A0A3S0X102_9GAMM|nr:ProQ/FINO family protein [Halomonas populi]RUR42367.1 ABC transporter substrate-binding protein [Halomonas populi]RUR46027.1 ABC transporter substrate-binding protein [Halomonas populi]
MTASVMHLLDSLESRLEQAQAELHALRKENTQLKQQLVEQAVSLHETLNQPSASAQQVSDTERHDTKEHRTEVPKTAAHEPEASETEMPKAAAAGQEAEAEVQHATESERTPRPENVASAEKQSPPSPHSLLKEWYQRYPQAFFKGHTKPLKVGIHQDLAAREPWSGKLIRRALANYVNLPRYLKSVHEGVDRVDLDGQPAGKVDKEASLHANKKRNEKQGEVPPKGAKKVVKKEPPKEKARLAKPPEKPEPAESERKAIKKTEQEKSLSLEDKLKGLQQKFKSR